MRTFEKQYFANFYKAVFFQNLYFPFATKDSSIIHESGDGNVIDTIQLKVGDDLKFSETETFKKYTIWIYRQVNITEHCCFRSETGEHNATDFFQILPIIIKSPMTPWPAL